MKSKKIKSSALRQFHVPATKNDPPAFKLAVVKKKKNKDRW